MTKSSICLIALVVGNILEKLPLTLDHEIKLNDPVDFKPWIEAHRDELREKGKVAVYDCDKFQFQVRVNVD